MSKITIDENKAKRVAYYVASAFLLDCRSMRSLTDSEHKEMWMGLYVDVWKEFSSKLDNAINRKSDVEILLNASEHMDDYAQPKEAAEFGLDPENTIDYDFEDAKTNIKQYIEDYFAALGSSADDRFKTE